MPITTQKAASVRERTAALGCSLPFGMVLLPENFDSAAPDEDLRFREEAATLAKLMRERGLAPHRLSETSPRTVFVHNRSFHWASPAIFVGAELLKQQPDVVAVLIDLVRDHLRELFADGGERKVSLEVVLEKPNGDCRRVKYEGDVEGLKDVDRIVKRLRG